MLTAAQPLTNDDAVRWARAGVPHWVPRWLLTAGWLLALGTTMLGGLPGTACTPDDPAVCGPDPAGTAFVVVMFATPVLLVWLPPLGCLAGVVAAAGRLLFGDGPEGQVAFGLHGAACLAVGLWLLASVGRQRRAAAAATGGLSAVVPAPVGEQVSPRLAGAAAAALLGTVLLGWYWHLAWAEHAHLARAVRADAAVVGTDHDGHVTVRVPGPVERDLGADVADAGAYPVAATVPVLVDPADPGWVRLVAEPLDELNWAGFGGGALLLALVLLGRDADRRRALRRLPGNRPAVGVRVVPDGDGGALVLPAAGPAVPVARLSVEAWPGGVPPQEPPPDPDAAEAAAERAWRGEPGPVPGFFGRGPGPLDAVLAGDLRDRGWALLTTADGLLVPAAPLAVRRWGGSGPVSRLPLAGAWRPADGSGPDDDTLPGVPVRAAAAEVPPLPLVARPSRDTWWLGVLALTAGLAASGAAIVGTLDGGLHRAALAIALLGGAEWGANRMLCRVELTADRLVLRNATRIVAVPWPRLAGVRRDGEFLFPKVRGGGEAKRYGPFEPGPDEPEEVAAARIAAVITALRDRAGEVTGATPATTSRRRPLYWVLALYGMATAAAVLWSWFG